ncbi:T9SS type A sorting domain-containing protein [Psychroserpens algicola]|uniref:T9SS type A sorting domain-containing protein n=1 Tax=Psychroserpens algicola TaxID=1719034 RepID=A0ABT0H424_9FLAO|nr:T9SS type A sorting domain-containing protein [Psychroserpens algicola]MCK8479129.1 T9SS type A sorting domain-containing protein [Psychroserpens algicola]
MKKTTSSKLSKQLTKYGALTAAIVGVADANGQSIIYDDIPDFTGGIGDTFLLDLNNDGTDDFQIRHNGSSNLYIDPLTASNDVLGSGGATFAYPFNLSSGTAISSGANSWFNNGFAGGFQSLNYGSCSFGNWCSVTDGYIGLRFNISGSIHYGWAQLDVDQTGSVWTVKAKAYHDTAGSAINAGQETLSIDNTVLEAIKIVSLGKSIGLYNLTEATNYRLVNMTGKVVLNGTTTDANHVIEANTIANGIYIIELTDVNSKAVIRKKVVL